MATRCVTARESVRVDAAVRREVRALARRGQREDHPAVTGHRAERRHANADAGEVVEGIVTPTRAGAGVELHAATGLELVAGRTRVALGAARRNRRVVRIGRRSHPEHRRENGECPPVLHCPPPDRSCLVECAQFRLASAPDQPPSERGSEGGSLARSVHLGHNRHRMASATVLVLAAGRGNRLAPLTDESPKCLLPVGKTSALELLFGTLEHSAVSEVVLVVGHAHERIAAFLSARRHRIPVEQIFNPRYDSANNIYSVHVARERCRAGFLLVNSDVLCHPEILRSALGDPRGSFLVVDPATPPRAEAMKVRYEGGRLAAITKDLAAETADGEYIGVARFDAEGAAALFSDVAHLLALGRTGEWYEAAIALAARRVPVGMVSTGSLPWIEIDDPADLQRAEREIIPRITS